MVKSEKEQYENTLGSLKNLCDRLVEITDEDIRTQILTNCQEAAIVLGERLESCTNPLDVSVVKEYQIVKKIEDFCEQVYVCSQEFCSHNFVILKSLLTEISVILESFPRTYRVVFLPYKASMWDSLESIWKCFAADVRCETSVVPIPYFEANRQLNQWDTCYEGDLYPDDVPVVHFQEYLLGDKKPDLAFVHNPFDEHNHVTTVHPAYYSQELVKHCGKIAYVPYYANPGYLSGDYNLLPLLYRVDYLIFQSEQMKESCKEFPYYNKVLPFGTPKFDKLYNLQKEGVLPPKEWNVDLTGKKSLLLNTTLTDFLVSGEKLMEKLQRFFTTVSQRDDLVIIWRPHPLLEGTVKAMRPQFVQKYEELIEFFNDKHVGVFDRTAEAAIPIVLSDGYIGSHYSSIIASYEFLNKPVFRFDSNNIYSPDLVQDRKRARAEDVFGMKNAFDFFGCYESNEYMFEDFVDDLMNDRLGEVLKKQAEQEAGIANNLDGTCGIKVHEYIMKDLIQNG